MDNPGGPEAEIVPGISIPFTSYTSEVHDISSPYRLTLKIEVRDGAPECRQFVITADADAPPITGVVLRSIPLATYVETTLEKITNRRGDALEELRAERGRRRQPKSDVLPRVVEAYRLALADPDPVVRKAPTQAVADRLHYQRGHVSRLLSEARRLGMLGPARRGRAGEAKTNRKES
ncbi:hypothetical protein [Nonomuraea sp. NPDC048916]|uniref:hypothetical protein n=1 Tax=Nonomuraea sp. NPDC048916 TaxID=3154232 RepID=UPI003410C16F